MSSDLGVLSCQQRPLEQPRLGVGSCIISTPHMCLCGVWGRLQITEHHDIQSMTYYSTAPSFFPPHHSLTLLTISHLGATNASSHHTPPIRPRLSEESVLKVNYGPGLCCVQLHIDGECCYHGEDIIDPYRDPGEESRALWTLRCD